MSDIENAITNLENQKQIKLVEIQKLDAAIVQLKALLGDIEPGHAPREMEYRGLGIADAAKRWISEVGGPRTTREIADAILARGLQTTSKNYTATVYAVLAASKDFHRTKDGTWEVKAK
jgi:hypothetical protein